MPLIPPIHRLRQLLATRGRPRHLTLRRITAVALALTAVTLAVRPPPQARGEPTVPMLVAARDLAPGSTLRRDDVRLQPVPASIRPATALTTPGQATGRVLAGATSRGEPLTRTRLVGPENTRLTTGDPSTIAVPVRLADPEVAALLMPGARVDVVTASPDGAAPGLILATEATVVSVRETTTSSTGRLVVIAVPHDTATRLASVSLGQPVAVTLR